MQMRAIDSHTEGEPTRVIIDGTPDLGSGTVSEQADCLARNHDHVRRGIVLEPRGSEVLVAAMLVPPADPSADFGVIFMNNAGILGMCVHGTIGVVRTLREMGRIEAGAPVTLETNVGLVHAQEEDDGTIAVENVASRRVARDVPVELEDRTVHADIAWGGNWFALVKDHGEDVSSSNIDALTELAWRIRRRMNALGLGGDDGGEVDHVELYGEPAPGADSRSFVLCPGGAYDRSPCGTGTSAKVACLAADETLAPGDTWVQESVIGSRFHASYRVEDGEVIPRIRGRAWITAALDLRFDPDDPFRSGIAPD
ncbi:MAG: proline racemase family protein [Phycisphaerales bacterium]|nr:proline racemase family protein [Phycisphaerales bacterium]